MTPRTTIGKNSFSTGPPLTQALIPAGAEVRIEAKIRSEIPLPISALRDQLAHPHQQGGAGGEGDHDQHEPAGVELAARRSGGTGRRSPAACSAASTTVR